MLAKPTMQDELKQAEARAEASMTSLLEAVSKYASADADVFTSLQAAYQDQLILGLDYKAINTLVKTKVEALGITLSSLGQYLTACKKLQEKNLLNQGVTRSKFKELNAKWLKAESDNGSKKKARGKTKEQTNVPPPKATTIDNIDLTAMSQEQLQALLLAIQEEMAVRAAMKKLPAKKKA